MILSPLPVQRFYSNLGLPLVGGKLFTYIVGTSTKLATYQDSGGTPNSNPIILNFRGEANIWLDPSKTYKFVLATALDSDPPAFPIWTVDNISAALSLVDLTQQFLGMILYPRTDAEIAAGIVPTFYFYPPGDVRRYGVKVDNVTDDTTATQTILNVAATLGRLYWPPGITRVTQITIFGLGLELEFDNCTISGIATTATNSVVEIKCGHSHIRGLLIGANRNTHYTCGVQWYTNDVNAFYPGQNRFDGIKVTSALIGMVIGGLPAQAYPLPASGTVQASGIATDAPLSESYIEGLAFYDCERGLYCKQSNGKITLLAPGLNSDASGWGTAANFCSLTNESSMELTVCGGSMEQNMQSTGSLAQWSGGTLTIDGTTIESVAPFCIGADAVVRVAHLQNWGLNNTGTAFFFVLSTATGELDLHDTFLLRNAGYSGSQPVIKTVTSFSTGTAGINSKFWVNATNVEFRDANFTQGATYNPLVFGCRSFFRNCWLTTYAGTTRTAQYKIDNLQNLLCGKSDVSGKALSAYPQTTNGTTSAGWTSTVSTASDKWGSDTSSLPTIEGVTAQAAIRVTSIAGQVAQLITAKIPCMPQRVYMFRGWIKTGASGAAATIAADFYDFSGAASSTAQISIYSAAESVFGSTYQPIIGWFQAPKDADQLDLLFNAQNGADIFIVNPELV